MFYRRNLPHWHPELSDETPMFITWRLAGSVPHIHIPETTTGRAFAALDRAADRAAFGPVWLRDARIARIVADALRLGDMDRHFYTLGAWVIMPNHVHVLLKPNVPLPAITRWLKGSTARAANAILGCTGAAFWKPESFDHRVRSEEQASRIIRYIEWNPVTAGFVAHPGDWPWSSATGQAKTPAPPPR